MSSPSPADFSTPTSARSNLHSLRQPSYPTSRAFLHWRLSDDGPGASRIIPIGRHPKPLYEREVVKGLSARLRSEVVSFCLAPCRAPSFRPDPQYLNAVARRAGQGWPSRCPCHARRISRPLLDRSEHEAGSGASGSLSPPAELVLKRSSTRGLYGEHPTDIKHLSTSVAPRHVKRVQQVQRRCPWARATIASPYIRQLRYGLPLCCMHGQSREKDGAHLHNGRLARPNLRWVSPATHPTRPTLPPKGASEPLACHLAFPVVGGLRIAPCGTMPCST
jgi:hypothetical protein